MTQLKDSMSNIEKIRQEIERRKKVYLTKNGFPKGTFGAIKIETYEGLLAFIDSLPEEKPSEDLEEAADICVWKSIDSNDQTLVPKFIPLLLSLFISGAYWQKEQIMKEAVVSDIGITSEGILLRDLRIEDFDYEDKAKIIIVNGDDRPRD